MFRVNTYAIFIAGEGDAEGFMKSMPLGHAFICVDTTKLPFIFKDIFTTALMKNFKNKL